MIVICSFLPTRTRAYCARDLAILDTYYNEHGYVFSLPLFSGLFLVLTHGYYFYYFPSVRDESRSHTRSVRGKVDETYRNRFVEYENIILIRNIARENRRFNTACSRRGIKPAALTATSRHCCRRYTRFRFNNTYYHNR